MPRQAAVAADGPDDAGAQLLMVRRLAIFAILFLAYIYYRSAGPARRRSPTTTPRESNVLMPNTFTDG